MSERHYCYYHPNVETSLRCNRCGKYICIRDARRTPVGYRCKECVKEQLNIFFNATPADYLIAAVVTLPLSYIAALIITSIGFFAIFVGAVAGGIIAEAVWRLTGKRRGRYIWLVVLVCMIVTAALRVFGSPEMMSALRFGGLGAVGLDLVWLGLYLVLSGGVVTARLRFMK